MEETFHLQHSEHRLVIQIHPFQRNQSWRGRDEEVVARDTYSSMYITRTAPCMSRGSCKQESDP